MSLHLCYNFNNKLILVRYIMKNIFSETKVFYVSGALAIGTLLASGVFAVAPYIGFLAPVAALSLGLPFVIGGAIFSVAVIALSYKAIGKNGDIRKQNTLLHEEAKKNAELTLKSEEKDAKISSLENQLAEYETFHDAVDVQKEQEERQEKFENRVAARKKEEANEMAELKAKGLLPDTIELPDKETETLSPESHSTQNGQSWAEWCTDKAKTAARLAAGVAIFAATVAPNFMGTFLEGPEVSSVDGRLNSTNNTLFHC